MCQAMKSTNPKRHTFGAPPTNSAITIAPASPIDAPTRV